MSVVAFRISRPWPIILLFFALLLSVLLLMPVSNAKGASASDYPSRPITIIVTFPPGGGTDLLARHLAVRLESRLGVPIIVENRPGASGNIGARVVAGAKPDGYTLLMVNSSFAINPGVYSQLGFSPRDDFDVVFNVAWVPSLVVTGSDTDMVRFQDLIDRASVDEVPVATCGNGTPQHLAMQMLDDATQASFQHIPYRGCGPALTDVAAGMVPAGIVTVSSAIPFIQSGRLRPLAVTADQRTELLPAIPTVAENGLPGYTLNQWHGLLAPAGVPSEALDLLVQTLRQVVQSAEMRDTLHAVGYTPADQTRPEFAALVSDEITRFGELTARMGLRVD